MREHNHTHHQKTGLKISEHGPTHQSKIQFSLEPVPPIRKLPQASYPHPSEGRQNENHSHRKLTKLIKWITALSNSMKLWAMPCRAIQYGSWWRVLTKYKEGNGKPLQYSFPENPMNSMKRQKDMTLKDELPRWVGAQYTTGEEWRNSSSRNEEAEPKWKQCPAVHVSSGESKVQCCKEEYCIETWNARSMNQGKLEMVK